MRRTDLTVAAAASAGGVLAITRGLPAGDPALGLVLGAMLLVDALARLQLARRR